MKKKDESVEEKYNTKEKVNKKKLQYIVGWWLEVGGEIQKVKNMRCVNVRSLIV